MQHLAQPRRVPADDRGDVRVDDGDELQAARGGRLREHVDLVLDGLADVEVDRLELEAASLDLGEVEDVVDDREQAVARRADHGHELVLLRA